MLSVVMLTYDLTNELAQMSETAVNSIKFSVPDAELVIIDNGSIYGSGFTKSQADIYIRNKHNLGYPGGVNQGVLVSHGDFIAIANNDIKVSPNWWEVAQEIFENKKVGAVHFRMDGYDEERPLGNETWLQGKERWCSSSFFVIRRGAFQVYDENYKQGGYDDYDHHHRMREIAGWYQAYTNKAAYQHADSLTYRTMERPDQRNERDVKNREHFKSKFGEYPDEQFARLFPDQMLVQWRPFP